MSLYLGDCMDLLRSLPDASVDSVVCDPPYGIGFMAAAWDASVPGVEWARECLRVLRPGGHVVAFGGTRTVHRLACAIEDGGFEIRDLIGWVYWSGFPKSLDVSKAIDAANGDPLAFRAFARAYSAAVELSALTHADIDQHLGIASSSCYWAREDHRGGLPPRHHWDALCDLLRLDQSLVALYDEAERKVVGHMRGTEFVFAPGQGKEGAARQIAITAPATPAARQWSGWGTALKPAIEPAVLARKPLSGTVAATVLEHGTGAMNIDGCRLAPGDRAWPGPDDEVKEYQNGPGGSTFTVASGPDGTRTDAWEPSKLGRWPANIYHCPKAPRSERERGCADLPARSGAEAVGREEGSAGTMNPRAGAGRTAAEVRNHHPTCKPVRLMRWLCRLVTPPGGVVLDPFSGSGSTGVAAVLEGFRFTGAEREPDYHRIASARIAHAQRYPEAWADTAPGRDDEPVAEVEELERVGQVRLFGGGE